MPHVLIVDDDVDTCQALATIAKLEGFTTTLAHSLREGRIQLARQLPDVILLDLGLPDGEGIDLFEGGTPPVGVQLVLITGNASLETSI